MTLDEINTMTVGDVEARLGAVFEHAPWIVRRAAARRPFGNRDELHRAMVATIDSASEDEQLALLRGHPELAGKAAIAGDLTAESRQEQRGAGLDRLTRDEYGRFHALNDAYKAKFGFPFIIAVKGMDKHAILATFATRLERDRATEFREALTQVGRIGGFRLADLVKG
jgi:2-oxo-4-hydroxy-4-carboxy-5-ureidoimidazoline decarboxylase